MEENRRFSWSSFFIKAIIIVIFVLFTVWLLSLSNKGLSNSLDVLTNNIFSQNMEKMKEVGKEYFTTERLPQKIGEVETLTLEDMYEKKLILELTDKNGNACSAENSYVSVEKYDDEYQMKVYLECGEENDYIIVIMGCYDYCDTDICEKEVEEDVTSIEYQYKKTTGGYWTDYGNWSEWSKVLVTNTDYRQIETKVETEEYTYDKTETEYEYVEYEAICKSGYKKTADGTRCYKVEKDYEYEDPECPTVSGYTKTSQNGFTCNYSKPTTKTTTGKANCPSGYTQSGNDCVKPVTSTTTKTATCPSGYKKSGNTCVDSTPDTKSPSCPTVSGYTKTSQNGFTCYYSKTTNDVEKPECPAKAGYTITSQNGFTCYYKSNNYTKGAYVKTETGERVPSNTSKYIYEEIGSAEYVYDCNNSCAFRWIHTWKVYKKVYETTTGKATCPSGYTQSGNDCVKPVTGTTTETATCPTGYKKSGNTCVESNPDTKSPSCPTVSGYTKTSQNGFTCYYSKTTNDVENPECPTKAGYTITSQNGFTCYYSKPSTSTTTKTATCPTGYSQSGNRCAKPVDSYKYSDLIMNCPAGYTDNGTNCYKTIEVTKTITETRNVTYYRYRIREYIGGTTDYKWSSSKEDKELLNAGYVLTGKTR